MSNDVSNVCGNCGEPGPEGLLPCPSCGRGGFFLFREFRYRTVLRGAAALGLGLAITMTAILFPEAMRSMNGGRVYSGPTLSVDEMKSKLEYLEPELEKRQSDLLAVEQFERNKEALELMIDLLNGVERRSLTDDSLASIAPLWTRTDLEVGGLGAHGKHLFTSIQFEVGQRESILTVADDLLKPGGWTREQVIEDPDEKNMISLSYSRGGDGDD